MTVAQIKGVTSLDKADRVETVALERALEQRLAAAEWAVKQARPQLYAEQAKYTGLVDRAIQLEKEKAHLAASDAKAQRELMVAQTELQRQALELKATEARVYSLQDDYQYVYSASQRQENYYIAEISRLQGELAASRSEVEVLTLDLNATKALATQQGDQLAITKSALDRRSEDLVKMSIEAERWQARAAKAEAECVLTLESLKKSEELMALNRSVIDTTTSQLCEVRNRELTGRVKLERVEKEHQEWIRRAKILDEALYTPRGTSLARSKLLSAKEQADSIDKYGMLKADVR